MVYTDVGKAQVFFGLFHKNSNHWTLVYIDMVMNQLLYIDPLGPPDEQGVAKNFSFHWLEWALLHNNIFPESSVPATLTAVMTQHAVQWDSRNCGIFTMSICN